MDVDSLFENAPKNKEIFDSMLVAKSKIDNINYKNIMVSVSGGSDSDILLDLCYRFDTEKKNRYVWFDTGLEYDATKRHIKYLEDKYDINIESIKPVKPIPVCCKEYGQPFLSKMVSEYINRLQNHGFTWTNESYEDLVQQYPNCKAALRWWCNANGEKSRFNIEYNKHLKEFMLENPPKFKISSKCCKFAKKDIAKKYKKDNDIHLSIVGVRKAEGGIRSSAYKNCFSLNDDTADEYRPIFWYKEDTKRDYEDYFDIIHSDCYSKYGLKRTGCCGCPYGRDFEAELKIIEEYEPKLLKAVNNIFGDSYDYTRKYIEFRNKMKALEKNKACD